MSNPLFHQLLGESFAAIPDSIKKLHDGRTKVLSGRCDVIRGTGVLSRFFGFVTSLPPAGDNQLIKVTIECGPNHEMWIRDFGHAKMQSTLTASSNILFERLGPMRFQFKLEYQRSRNTIKWHLIRVSLLGIPLAVKWFSAVTAEESERDGKYYFEVSAALPLAGMLVQYKGWLSD
jgi:hypothetical protein